ncbi:uncharacterized protein LOC109597115 isoform X3 [Aethina tumida]|uniref:uncharacterized protein LOC109597115 isoform X3 n=1 Tax=Aethina tumida TaxID=116153 RepID=UPI0021494B4A|nr:uncharacterized protein LOC109597115 isoform X3 [Aethina tumida]
MILNFREDACCKLILVQFALLLIQVKCEGHQSGAAYRSKMYLAIAASGGNPVYGRAFNRTLSNITQSYLAGRRGSLTFNVTLETLAIDLPENGSFSADLLETVCRRFQGKHVVAILVIGASPASFTVALASATCRVPVLWARGPEEDFIPTFGAVQESRGLEVHLAPTSREVVAAIRGLLLQAHWHTFTVMADAASATALRRPELWRALDAAPLHPTLVTLPNPVRPQSLFRKLADISRSTRGVVVLLSDRQSAIRILDDAKRLNMMDGHFVWLWIDTATAISIRNVTQEEKDKERERKDPEPPPQHRGRRGIADLDGVHVNYLLKNDYYLLFNREDVQQDVPAPRRPHKRREPAGVGGELPAGLLSLKPVPIKVDRHLVKGAVRLLVGTLRLVLDQAPEDVLRSVLGGRINNGCWADDADKQHSNFSNLFGRELKVACTDALAGKKFTQEIGVEKVDKSLVANFEILNLVPEHSSKDNETETTTSSMRWKRVGLVSGRSVRLDTIIWPGGDLSVAAVSSRARTVFRVVTALAPPFVMESELDEDGQCLRGLPCHRVLTSDKDNLTLVFNEMQRLEEEEEETEEADREARNSDYRGFTDDYVDDEERFFPFQKFRYRTNCCYGLSMDLLENIAQELEFDFRLYIVADGLFGSRIPVKSNRTKRDVGKKFLSYRFKEGQTKTDKETHLEGDELDVKWNGVVGDLVSGAAHMSFAALSVSSARSEVIDFSAPYFFSGVSFLAAPQQKSEIPLMAFLLPFSPELWIAIFTSLNITAIAVAIYEWLSPFGLNPWGRQRSKNFSMSSALWVMWGLLCGHLVAFKAPKSWPNKFLINVWGGFSVIFVASYTANIAALIAGLFFHNTVSNYHDRSLLSQKVGAPKASAAEYYVQKANQHLWQHMNKYALGNVEEGVERLRNGSLDILIADTPILDYYRATDHGCKLQKIGDTINEDTYAIGMTKGFPLKDSISAVIAKYSSNGYMDILQEKWYGGLPCFKLATDIAQPRPLGVAAVTGVFILLGVGIGLGLIILLIEHLFFKYTLPALRDKPKGSIWRSRNIMFFSQKLYRFINCVELVSPHHAARELVHTIRQGQITSLFQKSIKRKEHEQRRRRKSKAQFFEMIQEIRRQQQEEREPPLEAVTEVDSEYQLSPDEKKSKLSPSIIRRTFMRSSPKSDVAKIKSPTALFNKQMFSPRSKNKAKSQTSLNVRRFSTDSVFNSQTMKPETNSSVVGRRLSKDASAFLSSSPPDINSRRSSYLDIISSGNKLGGKSPILSIENISDCSSRGSEQALRKLSDSESIGKKLATLPKYREPPSKHRLQPQHSLGALGKSDEALSRNDLQTPQVPAAKSVNDICESTMNEKSNLSDDEIARRNQLTIKELQSAINKKEQKNSRDNNTKQNTTNPTIRIQVEDTTKAEKEKPSRHPPLSHRTKTRHQSLGEPTNPGNPDRPEPRQRRNHKLKEQSKSLDSNGGSSSRRPSPRSRSPHVLPAPEENLPPAPPPPNCSPRNSSNGRSPLERLSKEELVLLWRSSESELRSHLLKAIRDKEEPSDPT